MLCCRVSNKWVTSAILGPSWSVHLHNHNPSLLLLAAAAPALLTVSSCRGPLKISLLNLLPFVVSKYVVLKDRRASMSLLSWRMCPDIPGYLKRIHHRRLEIWSADCYVKLNQRDFKIRPKISLKMGVGVSHFLIRNQAQFSVGLWLRFKSFTWTNIGADKIGILEIYTRCWLGSVSWSIAYL